MEDVACRFCDRRNVGKAGAGRALKEKMELMREAEGTVPPRKFLINH